MSTKESFDGNMETPPSPFKFIIAKPPPWWLRISRNGLACCCGIIGGLYLVVAVLGKIVLPALSIVAMPITWLYLLIRYLALHL